MKKIKKNLVSTVSFVLIALMAGRAGALTLTGSTTVFPIAQACAEAFSDVYPDIRISVRGGGSSVGIASLMDRNTDIANASRPMKTKEIKTCKMKGVNPTEHIVAMDGIAVVAHPSVDMDRITIETIKGIFTGKFSNWAEVGSGRKKIVVISRDSASGTFEAFNTLVLGGSRVRPDALMGASNQAVVNIVSSTEGAIGYIGMGYLQESIKALTVNGVYPSKKTVLDKTYPLSRPLFMYTDGQPKGDVGKFMNFVFSSEGQKLVEEQGFVGVK